MCCQKFRKKEKNHLFLEAKMIKYLLQFYIYTTTFYDFHMLSKFVQSQCLRVNTFAQWLLLELWLTWRNSLTSLMSLWTILLQYIGTKWWLLLVPGMVFDFAKQSSRSAWTLTISSWLTLKMFWITHPKKLTRTKFQDERITRAIVITENINSKW